MSPSGRGVGGIIYRSRTLDRRILFIDQPSALLDGRIPVTASHVAWHSHDRRSESLREFRSVFHDDPRVCKGQVAKVLSALRGVSRPVMKILHAHLKHGVSELLYAHKSWSPVRLLGTFRSFRAVMHELHRSTRVSLNTRPWRVFVPSFEVFTFTFGSDCG